MTFLWRWASNTVARHRGLVSDTCLIGASDVPWPPGTRLAVTSTSMRVRVSCDFRWHLLLRQAPKAAGQQQGPRIVGRAIRFMERSEMQPTAEGWRSRMMQQHALKTLGRVGKHGVPPARPVSIRTAGALTTRFSAAAPKCPPPGRLLVWGAPSPSPRTKPRCRLARRAPPACADGPQVAPGPR